MLASQALKQNSHKGNKILIIHSFKHCVHCDWASDNEVNELLKDGRAISPFIDKIILSRIHPGYKPFKSDMKGVDGILGSKSVEVRSVTNVVNFNLAVNVGGGRSSDNAKVKSSLECREYFWLVDNRESPTCYAVLIPISKIKEWFEDGEMNSTGTITAKRFWEMVLESYRLQEVKVPSITKV